MKKIAMLVAVIAMLALAVGCLDKNETSTNINTVITSTNGAGEEVVVMVLAHDGGAWIEVETASTELLVERDVFLIEGEYVHAP